MAEIFRVTWFSESVTAVVNAVGTACGTGFRVERAVFGSSLEVVGLGLCRAVSMDANRAGMATRGLVHSAVRHGRHTQSIDALPAVGKAGRAMS